MAGERPLTMCRGETRSSPALAGIWEADNLPSGLGDLGKEVGKQNIKLHRILCKLIIPEGVW